MEGSRRMWTGVLATLMAVALAACAGLTSPPERRAPQETRRPSGDGRGSLSPMVSGPGRVRSRTAPLWTSSTRMRGSSCMD